jgi:hypothetical protein
MERKVRIRYLTNTEASMMALLPDLARFTELMTQMQVKAAADENATITLREGAELETERQRYMRHLAHTNVVDRSLEYAKVPCEECSEHYGRDISHEPALWTMEQTGFLDFPDLTHITRIAERAEVLETVAPLSEGQTPNDSSSPANTGAQTQLTNSD